MLSRISGEKIETNNFTSESLDRGIAKLKRRISDVQLLNPSETRFNDAEVKNIEHYISETIREIFGENSEQYRLHRHHRIWRGGYNSLDTEDERQSKFVAGIPQTISMLTGLIQWLEEKKLEIETDPKARATIALKGMELHHRIAEVCVAPYKDGHYEEAVFNAAKALVNFVKDRSDRHDLDGAPLMREVFSKKTPLLAFNDLSEQSDLEEQEGMMHLYEGAVQAVRNPRAHSFLNDSPQRALEYIGLLSLLANRLEEAKLKPKL